MTPNKDTQEKIDEIVLKLRAGKDPDTGWLHITDDEARTALYKLCLCERQDELSRLYGPINEHVAIDSHLIRERIIELQALIDGDNKGTGSV